MTFGRLNYVTLDRIKREHAHYNWLIGQRSNGKTFACLKEAVENYVLHNKKTAILRRWKEDFRGKRGQHMFDGIVNAGVVKKATSGEWSHIEYYAGQWFFARWDDELEKMIKAPEPFCYGFALSEMEHDKSTSYEDVDLIIFDEAISRQGYLVDEFVVFCNCLSTLIRQRGDGEGQRTTIYMLGNTINKYCPYFHEMGLGNVDKMQPGDLRVYTYGSSGLKVAVQFTDNLSKTGKPSDVYFAFNNPKLQMITGQGQVWELEVYPHCPRKYFKQHVIYSYFIDFNNELLQCDIVCKDDEVFTFIHRKTGKIKYPEEDLVFSLMDSPRLNHRKYINQPFDKLGKKIYYFFQINKVFYQDNEIGELVRNYLMQKGA